MLARSLMVSVVVGSLVMMAVALRRGARGASDTRRGVAAGMSTLLLGLAGLVAMRTPADAVVVGTTLLFVAASVWFAVLEWRLTRKR